MGGTALLALYGLCAWGAALNFPAWARLAWLRWRMPDRPARRTDTILLTRGALSLSSLGIAALAVVRLAGSLSGEMPLAVPSRFGLIAIGLMAAAEPMFLRVDQIHAQARGTWSLSWRLYWAGAAAWLFVATAQAALTR